MSTINCSFLTLSNFKPLEMTIFDPWTWGRLWLEHPCFWPFAIVNQSFQMKQMRRSLSDYEKANAFMQDAQVDKYSFRQVCQGLGFGICSLTFPLVGALLFPFSFFPFIFLYNIFRLKSLKTSSKTLLWLKLYGRIEQRWSPSSSLYQKWIAMIAPLGRLLWISVPLWRIKQRYRLQIIIIGYRCFRVQKCKRTIILSKKTSGARSRAS